jgi:hypothetical protein
MEYKIRKCTEAGVKGGEKVRYRMSHRIKCALQSIQFKKAKKVMIE